MKELNEMEERIYKEFHTMFNCFIAFQTFLFMVIVVIIVFAG